MNLETLSRQVERILTPIFLQKTCDIYRRDGEEQAADLSPENDPARIYSVVKCDVVTVKEPTVADSAGRLEYRVGLEAYLPLSVHVLDGDEIVMRETGKRYEVKGPDVYDSSAGLNVATVTERF